MKVAAVEMPASKICWRRLHKQTRFRVSLVRSKYRPHMHRPLSTQVEQSRWVKWWQKVKAASGLEAERETFFFFPTPPRLHAVTNSSRLQPTHLFGSLAAGVGCPLIGQWQ